MFSLEADAVSNTALIYAGLRFDSNCKVLYLANSLMSSLEADAVSNTALISAGLRFDSNCKVLCRR